MAVPTTLVIDATQQTLEITTSRDAVSIQGRSVETGTPTDGEVMTYSTSSSEWIYQTITENVDDRVAALIQDSATGGLTWAYDDSAGTLTPSNSLLNADINASAAIAVSKLASSAVSYGGVSVTLGAADATPAFNLADATAYPGDSSLVTTGTVTSGVWNAGALTTSGHVTISATNRLYLDGGGNTFLRESAADTIMLTTNNTDRWKVNASGHLLAEGDNNYDIGASGANRPRDVFIAGTTTGAAASFTTISGSTSLVLASGATVTGIDNGSLGSSATLLATQGAIKTYVDSQVTAQDLDIISDSGNIDIDLDSESLTLAGGTGLASSASSTTVTFAIDSTVATLSGSQTLTNKTIAGGSNTLSAIANSSLTNSTVAYGGVSLSLGGADTTPAFNLSDATAYTGDSSLVTVGTISSGTWNGSAITGAYIDPTSSPLANTKLWIGSASNVAAEFALSGNATMTAGGVVTVSTAAACTGNAATATALQTARTIGGTSFDGTANIAVALSATTTALATARAINGVDFDGTAAVTITAAAGTVTGATLNSGVTASSLTSLGTIGSLVATSADINGGTLDGATVGASSASTGAFTTLSASSTSAFTGNVGIGGTHTADELLHVKEGAGTTPTPDGPTIAIFQRNPATGHDCGVAIVSGTSGTAALTFGDSDDDNRGGVLYAQGTDTMSFRVSAGTYASLTSGVFTVATTAVKFTNLPLEDPSVAGELWNSSGDVRISAG